MSLFKIAGWVSWFSGILLLVFQTISSFMRVEEGFAWKNISLGQIFEEDYFSSLDRIPWENVQGAAYYVVNMPLYLLLFCVGLLCFLLNGFLSK